MGCHTWFKTKSKYSLEEIRQIWIQQQKKWIQQWEDYTFNPELKEKRLEIFTTEKTQKEFEYYLEVYKRQLRKVESGHVKYSFVDNLLEGTDEGILYEYYNDTIFVDNRTMPHDIFRIGGYPEDLLFSYDDTIKFIQKNNIEYDDIMLNKLKKFWDENPIGLIRFG